MKKIISLLCGILLISSVAFAQEKSATSFISQTVDEIVKNVLTADLPKEKKTALFEEHILKAIDTEAIAKTVLGQYWRTATEKEKDDFIEAFKNMAIKMSAERFDMYTGQEVKFFAERPAQGKNQVFVDSTISADPKPIQVVWRVRQKDGEYRVIDIIVEGVSMALSYRTEYTSYLQTHSMNELIEKLNYQATHAAEITAEDKKKEEQSAAKAK